MTQIKYKMRAFTHRKQKLFVYYIPNKDEMVNRIFRKKIRATYLRFVDIVEFKSQQSLNDIKDTIHILEV